MSFFSREPGNLSSLSVGAIPVAQSTSSTALLTPGAAGTVLRSEGAGVVPVYATPYYSAGFIYLSTGGSTTGTVGAFQKVNCTTTAGTLVNMTTGGSSARLVASGPASTIASIDVSIGVRAGEELSANNGVEFCIAKNGAYVYATISRLSMGAVNDRRQVSLTALLPAEAGDYFEVFIRNNTSAGIIDLGSMTMRILCF